MDPQRNGNQEFFAFAAEGEKHLLTGSLFIRSRSKGTGWARVVRGMLRLRSEDSFGPPGNRGVWARGSQRKEKHR